MECGPRWQVPTGRASPPCRAVWAAFDFSLALQGARYLDDPSRESVAPIQSREMVTAGSEKCVHVHDMCAHFVCGEGEQAAAFLQLVLNLVVPWRHRYESY
eukprot:scaffold3189_cov138-Isochrysis_galbana.AAC.8